MVKANKRKSTRRKAKNSHNRGGRSREQKKRILIVCEGFTEKNYLNDVKESLHLQRAAIDIKVQQGKDKNKVSPSQILDKAKSEYKKSRNNNNTFDRVYCVIDGDTLKQDEFNRIVEDIEKQNFVATTSVPCIEYWFLLHFIKSTPSFDRCKEMKSLLIKHIPDYIKNDKKRTCGLFSSIKAKQEVAVENAEWSLSMAELNGTNNPTTKMHELILYLENIPSQG